MEFLINEIKNEVMPIMVVCGYNPSTWKAEVGRSLVQGQPGLCSETLSQKNTKTKKEKKPCLK
jgi:hypothetical protein